MKLEDVRVGQTVYWPDKKRDWRSCYMLVAGIDGTTVKLVERNSASRSARGKALASDLTLVDEKGLSPVFELTIRVQYDFSDVTPKGYKDEVEACKKSLANIAAEAKRDCGFRELDAIALPETHTATVRKLRKGFQLNKSKPTPTKDKE